MCSINNLSFVYLFTYLFIYLFVYLFIYYLFIYLFIGNVWSWYSQSVKRKPLKIDFSSLNIFISLSIVYNIFTNLQDNLYQHRFLVKVLLIKRETFTLEPGAIFTFSCWKCFLYQSLFFCVKILVLGMFIL